MIASPWQDCLIKFLYICGTLDDRYKTVHTHEKNLPIWYDWSTWGSVIIWGLIGAADAREKSDAVIAKNVVLPVDPRLSSSSPEPADEGNKGCVSPGDCESRSWWWYFLYLK